MSETMWLYFPIIWALFFPAMCWFNFRSIDFNKANMYFYIWIASPLLLPIIIAVLIAWYPVKWTARIIFELGVPMFKISEILFNSVHRLLSNLVVMEE